MAREAICGIYCITNMINGKRYIGQSRDIYHRWVEHKRCSREDGDNLYIHRAIRKYGVDNFDFSIIERCPQDELDEK